MSRNKERYRFYEIDLLRFLAAMAVVLFHYTFRGHAKDDMTVVSYPFLGEAFRYGYLGVDLFFIISGFVILLTAYNRDPGQFVISRMTRLYPAFWACVTVTFVVTFLLGGERYHATVLQYAVNLTMLHTFVGVDHMDGVYWSLIVELKFYFLVLLILLAGRIHNIKRFLWAWFLVSIMLLVRNGPGSIEFFLIPKWAFYFIGGATFFLIRKEGFSVQKGVLLVGCHLGSLWQAFVTTQKVSGNYGVDMSFLVVATLISIFYGAFWCIACGQSRRFSIAWFTSLGMLTYPLYLIHQHVGYMLFNGLHGHINDNILLLLVVALVLAYSLIVSTKIERRLARSLKDLLTRGLSALRIRYPALLRSYSK